MRYTPSNTKLVQSKKSRKIEIDSVSFALTIAQTVALTLTASLTKDLVPF
jgi:hypothetical protein